MTNRLTSHDKKTQAGKPLIPEFSRFEVCDSYSNSMTDTPVPGGAEAGSQRLSHKRLLELDRSLGEREKEVLLTIRRHRYLMTGQVQRLIFLEAATPSAARRAASRCLKKLRGLGLVCNLSRRIGGVRAGSASLVWYLSHAGERLLRLHEHRPVPVRRFFEPSPYFLAHTLAVAEISIQLTELCRGEKTGQRTKLAALQPEPECWRPYSERGVQVSLKPDLYAATLSGEYEDRWFFEIDLATESPAKVIEKCRRYHQYYRTGLEQKASGVFPLTVWIAPNERRRDSLASHICTAFEKQPRLFAVITADELAHLILHGGDERMLC